MSPVLDLEPTANHRLQDVEVPEVPEDRVAGPAGHLQQGFLMLSQCLAVELPYLHVHLFELLNFFELGVVGCNYLFDFERTVLQVLPA